MDVQGITWSMFHGTLPTHKYLKLLCSISIPNVLHMVIMGRTRTTKCQAAVAIHSCGCILVLTYFASHLRAAQKMYDFAVI